MRPLLAVLLVASSVTELQSASIPSPLAVPDSAVDAPFLTPTNSGPSVRFQQVYGSSDFARFGSPEYLITELRFEGGVGSGPIDVTLANMQIFLSTTQGAPDSLSAVFANNIGADNRMVYSGPLHLFANNIDTSYSIHIPLQQSFLYDPVAGNLLLEVKNFQTIPPRPDFLPRLLGARGVFGDSVSLSVAIGVDSDIGILTTGGLTTLFTVTGVPEPSSTLLFSLGIGALAVSTVRRRNKRSRRVQSNQCK